MVHQTLVRKEEELWESKFPTITWKDLNKKKSLTSTMGILRSSSVKMTRMEPSDTIFSNVRNIEMLKYGGFCKFQATIPMYGRTFCLFHMDDLGTN